ncbi:MAG: ferredoxin family protein [Nitrososphaerales archaeon]
MVSVVIDSSKCEGHGSCVDVCPVGVFQLDNANSKCVVVNQNDCILCDACITQCPTQAITVSE